MNRTLKVLHLIEDLGSGGAERLLYTNLRHLDSAVIESEVVTVFGHHDFWKVHIEELGVKVSGLGCDRYSDIPRGVSRLRRHIAADPPDLIHTHLFAANVVGRIAGRLQGIPVVSSIHNPEYEPEALDSVSASRKAKITTARLIDSITASTGCTKMVGVSEFVRDSVVKKLGYPAAKIEIIYNPITSADVKPINDREAVLEGLGLPANARVLLNVGRVGPQKGMLNAIGSMPGILEEVPNTYFLSVGAQPEPDYLRRVNDKIGELGVQDRVRLLGQRNDIADLLASCDVFVFPSLFEGLGIALAEAMAAGCACVVSDIKPFDEFLTNGGNAVIVPPANPEELSKAIVELLRDDEKRRKLGAAARETAIRMFSPGPAARKLEAMYAATAKS
ncbi:MAG TPA: glycosyltransferase [Pyrinomonadaceae bacterium]|nr:glycosyltransferase [Pyrinomonadaceae bacterium]